MEREDKAFFDERRHTQPQQVIDALVEQTARQGRAIYDLRQELAALTSKHNELRVENETLRKLNGKASSKKLAPF